jgi:hypothetical protein
MVTIFQETCIDITQSVIHCKNDVAQTDISVNISKVIRQRKLLLDGYSRNGPYLKENLARHRQCNVGYGPGLFLFTGKWRLGQLKLTCSPYYNDWMLVLKRAINTGQMRCSKLHHLYVLH